MGINSKAVNIIVHEISPILWFYIFQARRLLEGIAPVLVDVFMFVMVYVWADRESIPLEFLSNKTRN